MLTQAAPIAEKQVTLNDRLNKASESLQYQCDRIESVLSRVNGTPSAGRPGAVATPINPTLAMATALEHLEAATRRLADLATNVEQIA